jgi:hypothetical protein
MSLGTITWGDYANQGIIISKVSTSGTTPIVSDVIDCAKWRGISFQLITTSTLHGDWKVEVSNDYSDGLLNAQALAGRWSDITSQFSPAIVTVTAASNQYVQLDPFAGGALRFTFTPSSSSGTISVCGFGKTNS